MPQNSVCVINLCICHGGILLEYTPTASTLALVKQLGGRWHGRYAMVLCPAHSDREPSLSIRQGRHTILVHCFAGCDGGEVMRAIRALLGGPLPYEAAPVVVRKDQSAPFRRLWDCARPIVGTPAERYLRDIRGIHIMPPDVRYHAECPMGRGPAPRRLPALLVGVFVDMRLIAIQRLFLDPVTGHRTHRMILGNSRGGTWPAAFAGGAMRLAEGFETACAYAQLTRHEAGTCFGARNFGGFGIARGTERVTLLPDNDIEGLEAARRAMADRHAADLPFAIEHCPAGAKDWADLVRPDRLRPAA